ncbi:hypothetical protein AX774_g5089 [Zancudomyces culisetae]|uniref:Rad60/SUMO-like domain-containing protein n=1 Tax=Zancudomyces culisetae TaxID=1213189 RepID=A0A1R1PKF3_ZANCU|nr:hypothetical protein AX774_g5089 [Zancudomyces culisetae]|eukprot:OMH81458.1 hypothetical protein AX774_g5089 [Zancudomyces culisetae]
MERTKKRIRLYSDAEDSDNDSCKKFAKHQDTGPHHLEANEFDTDNSRTISSGEDKETRGTKGLENISSLGSSEKNETFSNEIPEITNIVKPRRLSHSPQKKEHGISKDIVYNSESEIDEDDFFDRKVTKNAEDFINIYLQENSKEIDAQHKFSNYKALESEPSDESNTVQEPEKPKKRNLYNTHDVYSDSSLPPFDDELLILRAKNLDSKNTDQGSDGKDDNSNLSYEYIGSSDSEVESSELRKNLRSSGRKPTQAQNSTRKVPKTTKKPREKSAKSKIINIDTEYNSDPYDQGLDPALKEILESKKTQNSSQAIIDIENYSQPDKRDEDEPITDLSMFVQLCLKVDEKFISTELEPMKGFFWNGSKCTTKGHIEKAVKSPINAVFRNDERFSRILLLLSAAQNIPSDTNSMVLVYNGTKIYHTVTPKAISNEPHISLALTSTESFCEINSQTLLQEPTPAHVESIKIKIRNKEGNDQFLSVKSTIPISAIIEAYKKLCGLGVDTTVRLNFDDEYLDGKATLLDSGIEDDDMLLAFY